MSSVNRAEGIAIHDPASLDERAVVAEACAVRLKIEMPVLLDELDDEVARHYGAWPDRLYLIGRDGRVAFQGDEGPMGFLPEQLRAAIEEELARIDRADGGADDQEPRSTSGSSPSL